MKKSAVPVLQRENGAAEIIKTIISGELRCSASSVVAALTAAVATPKTLPAAVAALATAVASPVAVATAAAVAALASVACAKRGAVVASKLVGLAPTLSLIHI